MSRQGWMASPSAEHSGPERQAKAARGFLLALRRDVAAQYGPDSLQAREVDRLEAALFTARTLPTTPLQREVSWR